MTNPRADGNTDIDFTYLAFIIIITIIMCLGMIEMPIIKPHTVTLEVQMCTYRDGLGYLHRCHHPQRGCFFQCEAAIHFGECPLGYVTGDTITEESP